MQSCPPYSLNLESLGEGNFIFVDSSTDEWAANVPSEWIEQILDYCDCFDYSLPRIKTRNRKTGVLWVFFRIHTVNAVCMIEKGEKKGSII